MTPLSPDRTAAASGAPILPSEGRASRPVGFLDALAGNVGTVPLEIIQVGLCNRCHSNPAITRSGRCESCEEITLDIAQSWNERSEMEL